MLLLHCCCLKPCWVVNCLNFNKATALLKWVNMIGSWLHVRCVLMIGWNKEDIWFPVKKMTFVGWVKSGESLHSHTNEAKFTDQKQKVTQDTFAFPSKVQVWILHCICESFCVRVNIETVLAPYYMATFLKFWFIIKSAIVWIPATAFYHMGVRMIHL